MSDLPKIDIIIPAYKAQNTILRTLSSIAEQEILEDLEVTIVNDCDGSDYKKFVDMFSPYMKIREIKMDKNGGPGAARAYGIEHTTNPIITFIDADDVFSGRFALKILRLNMIQDPRVVCVFSNFLEDQQATYIQHPQDTVWMFGKIYRRDFLDKYNIKCAPNPRSNEDGYFNTLCRLCQTENEKIAYNDSITYYWCFKEDSITRINNANYSYNQSYVGFTENQIAAIKEAEKWQPFNGEIIKHKVTTMCNLYEYLLETKRSDEKYFKQNWDCCVKYYKEVYREVKDKISDQILSDCYNDVMQACYVGGKMFGIIPHLGFREFLQQLEKECVEEEKSTK